MALVTDHWELTVTLLDNGNATLTKNYELRAAGGDAAAIAADAAANAAALVGDLSGVTDLEITGYRISQVFIEDDVTIPTALNAQKEMQARISLQLDTSPLKKAVHDIPGPKDTLFVGAAGTANYDIVDTADALLIAYFEEFESTGSVTLSDGEDLHPTAGIIRGRRTHRASSLG